MARYRKKPVVIEAVKYLGHGNVENRETPDWVWDAFENGTLVATNDSYPLRVKTLAGQVVISPGDYIMRGVKGELYPCKPDIFEQTHEPVEVSV